ncbi:uncharacterized protein LOC115440752 [Manduca sexta]|uniref:SUEL-type lectin domain-containing protein n=1 Tax=Manduca sexta TaxID=7130 RepID=A0A922CH38_MANSE|nr:uncharacterized protein LOC115440752 [Manduca sexta]KAG6445911.1 hypothetical protein O3G_MSEX004162 [Manduca sexta]
MYCVFVVVGFLLLPGPSCTNSDNLALLLNTLKTTQRAVCDDEMVFIECPKGTAISILVAQYGKASLENSACAHVSSGSSDEQERENCKRPNAMQYDLLQTVVEACQKKQQCTFSTTPRPGIVDPCPFTRKYIEVSYKCRPHDFISETVCEDELMELSCNPHSRIAIFDAQYGRTAYEIACPAHGVTESCSTPYTVEKVMQVCHGKRRCLVLASGRTFESFCGPQIRPYLKIVYACVPLGIISERYETPAEVEEIDSTLKISNDNRLDKEDRAGDKWGDIKAGTTTIGSVWQPPVKHLPPLRTEETTIFTSLADPALQPRTKDVTPPPNTNANVEKTKELSSTYKLYIFIGIAVVVFVILTAIFIGIRCYLDQKAKSDSKNGDMFTTEAPNVFNDAVSDIDNDVDVSHISGTFYDPVHPDMILFKDVPGSRGTLRAMKPLSTIYPIAGASMYGNVDYVPSQTRDIPTRFTRSRSKEEQSTDMMMSPKSLASYSNSNFYYG